MKPSILERVVEAGHQIFENGDYDVNLIGVRSANRVANRFDDTFHCVWKENNTWHEICVPCTTDPGSYWLAHGRVEGTAILKAGQYRGAWTIGKHRGQYDALVQIRPVDVWRDNNRDEVLNMEGMNIQKGIFGINIHRANPNPDTPSTAVNKWSAGCTVIQNAADFQRIMAICKLQLERRGWPNFTYTLLED
jgi:hypothetical protein